MLMHTYNNLANFKVPKYFPFYLTFLIIFPALDSLKQNRKQTA